MCWEAACHHNRGSDTAHSGSPPRPPELCLAMEFSYTAAMAAKLQLEHPEDPRGDTRIPRIQRRCTGIAPSSRPRGAEVPLPPARRPPPPSAPCSLRGAARAHPARDKPHRAPSPIRSHCASPARGKPQEARRPRRPRYARRALPSQQANRRPERSGRCIQRARPPRSDPRSERAPADDHAPRFDGARPRPLPRGGSSTPRPALRD